jgi:hypothetical protein
LQTNGFPCGHYQVNVLNHDDEAELWIDGVEVWSEGGASDNASNNVWQGVLGPNSTIVFRVNNSGYGQSKGAIDLVLTDNNIVTKPTITPNGYIDICAGTPVELTSSASADNLWNTGATTQSIDVNTGNYYVSVVGPEGCTAQSDVVSVTTHKIVPGTVMQMGMVMEIRIFQYRIVRHLRVMWQIILTAMIITYIFIPKYFIATQMVIAMAIFPTRYLPVQNLPVM